MTQAAMQLFFKCYLHEKCAFISTTKAPVGTVMHLERTFELNLKSMWRFVGTAFREY